jgi:hypothetical protein
VDSRACLDDEEKRKILTLPGLEFRPLGRPARSQSLYRLRYPGSGLELKGRISKDEAAVPKDTLEHTGSSSVIGRLYATLQMQFISKYLTKKITLFWILGSHSGNYE